MKHGILLLTFGCLQAMGQVAHGQNVQPVSLKLEAETVQRLGIESVPLVVTQRPQVIHCFGEVVNPAPLVSRWHEVETAQLQAQQARREAERSEQLAQAGQLVSAHSVELAQLQFRTASLMADAATTNLQMEWGLESEDPMTESMVKALQSGSVVLVRLSLPVGASLPAVPESAWVRRAGSSTSGYRARSLWLAPTTSSQQEPGYFALVDNTAGLFPAGLGVAAYLELPGTPYDVLSIPSDAVVYDSGAAWVYQLAADGTFQRCLIGTDLPEPEGWFVPTGSLDTSHPIITRGSQALHSQEVLARMGIVQE